MRSSIYDAIGGMQTCRRLAEAFYARVPRSPVLTRVYGHSFHCAIDSLTHFLAQYFGGPLEYAEGRWFLSLYEAHLRFRIGQAERDAWIANMHAALEEVGIDAPVRAEMEQFFERTSAYLINRGGMHGAPPLVLDAAVAAVRRGDLERVAELARDPEFTRDRAAWVSLLAIMAESEDPRLLDYALAALAADPGLVRERFTYGRTLLHAAAASGCVRMVERLLALGADPNATDRYGHPPLYAVGNQCSRETGDAVVRLLVRGGADVNLQDRVKRCTPLHMAARRGNVGVARALLECGADRAIRDIAGVTPLQRARNCRKPGVVALLEA
jgi:hemoglobin